MDKTYSVDLISHKVLGRRLVKAKNKKEAEDKALLLFDKFDLDDYDEVEVELQKEECSVCGTTDDVNYGCKFGVACHCSCELLSIENNPDVEETEEEFLERMRKK